MKLDVQGAEEKVLRGGLATIASYLPVLIIEQSQNMSFDALLGPLAMPHITLRTTSCVPARSGVTTPSLYQKRESAISRYRYCDALPVNAIELPVQRLLKAGDAD